MQWAVVVVVDRWMSYQPAGPVGEDTPALPPSSIMPRLADDRTPPYPNFYPMSINGKAAPCYCAATHMKDSESVGNTRWCQQPSYRGLLGVGGQHLTCGGSSHRKRTLVVVCTHPTHRQPTRMHRTATPVTHADKTLKEP
jgi:hypothetical protein